MNIVSAEFKANPFPVLARLRSEEPIHRTTLPDKIKTLLDASAQVAFLSTKIVKTTACDQLASTNL